MRFVQVTEFIFPHDRFENDYESMEQGDGVTILKKERVPTIYYINLGKINKMCRIIGPEFEWTSIELEAHGEPLDVVETPEQILNMVKLELSL